MARYLISGISLHQVPEKFAMPLNHQVEVSSSLVTTEQTLYSHNDRIITLGM